jgi:hypothetical protein
MERNTRKSKSKRKYIRSPVSWRRWTLVGGSVRRDNAANVHLSSRPLAEVNGSLIHGKAQYDPCSYDPALSSEVSA